MWHADPDITYQLARDEQEKKISDHVRRTQARKQKQGGMISTVLGQVGDWLVGAGEALRRRAQTASPLASDGFGI
jgi:hypothetical protein